MRNLFFFYYAIFQGAVSLIFQNSQKIFFLINFVRNDALYFSYQPHSIQINMVAAAVPKDPFSQIRHTPSPTFPLFPQQDRRMQALQYIYIYIYLLKLICISMLMIRNQYQTQQHYAKICFLSLTYKRSIIKQAICEISFEIINIVWVDCGNDLCISVTVFIYKLNFVID